MKDSQRLFMCAVKVFAVFELESLLFDAISASWTPCSHEELVAGTANCTSRVQTPERRLRCARLPSISGRSESATPLHAGASLPRHAHAVCASRSFAFHAVGSKRRLQSGLEVRSHRWGVRAARVLAVNEPAPEGRVAGEALRPRPRPALAFKCTALVTRFLRGIFAPKPETFRGFGRGSAQNLASPNSRPCESLCESPIF